MVTVEGWIVDVIIIDVSLSHHSYIRPNLVLIEEVYTMLPWKQQVCVSVRGYVSCTQFIKIDHGPLVYITDIPPAVFGGLRVYTSQASGPMGILLLSTDLHLHPPPLALFPDLLIFFGFFGLHRQ